MLCNTMLVAGSAQVNISSTGRMQRPKVLPSINSSLPEYFTTHPSDLTLQAHHSTIDKSGIWHNDNSSSDWLNHLMAETFIDNRFIDPNLPPPTFSQAVTIFCAMYNKHLLFSLRTTKIYSSLHPDLQLHYCLSFSTLSRPASSFPLLRSSLHKLYCVSTPLRRCFSTSADRGGTCAILRLPSHPRSRCSQLAMQSKSP